MESKTTLKSLSTPPTDEGIGEGQLSQRCHQARLTQRHETGTLFGRRDGAGGSEHMRTGRACKRLSGFTLIELMITLVVIAILAGIAYPSYVDYLRKGRRADAKAALLELAQQVERHYTTTNAYTGVTLDAGVTSRVSTHYTISFSVQAAQSFTLQAVPTSAQSSDVCGTLTITHTGARTPSTTGCWN